MTDFFAASVAFQRAMLRITSSMVSASMEIQSQLLKQQFDLFNNLQDARRMDDLHDDPAAPKTKKTTKRRAKRKASPCKGPDLLNHYGKRAHDVDVEHIR